MTSNCKPDNFKKQTFVGITDSNDLVDLFDNQYEIEEAHSHPNFTVFINIIAIMFKLHVI